MAEYENKTEANKAAVDQVKAQLNSVGSPESVLSRLMFDAPGHLLHDAKGNLILTPETQ